MKLSTKTLAVIFLLAPSTVGAQETPLRSGNATFDGMVATVLANFYAPAELDRFRDAVALTVASLPSLAEGDKALTDDAIDFALASLETSHTARYTPDDLDYYELMDVFRYAVRDGVRRLYGREGVVYEGVGMATARNDGATFVTDVYDGAAADRAGLLVGDEIVSVDGQPYSEIGSFQGKAGQKAALLVRRERDGNLVSRDVDVAPLHPSRTLLGAIRDSAEVVDAGGFRIGYLRLWAYTEGNARNVIEQALAGPLAEADGLVLDLRSRWGGAPADAADSFVGGAPDMTMTGRDGGVEVITARWRKPVVAIIDEGTRSGMEILAYALKANGVKLVGANTARAVVAGRGYMLPDDSLLVLAVADVHVDGTRLEGVGVAPDIAVPFDIRYAAGADPQRDAAVAEMVRSLTSATRSEPGMTP